MLEEYHFIRILSCFNSALCNKEPINEFLDNERQFAYNGGINHFSSIARQVFYIVTDCSSEYLNYDGFRNLIITNMFKHSYENHKFMMFLSTLPAPMIYSFSEDICKFWKANNWDLSYNIKGIMPELTDFDWNALRERLSFITRTISDYCRKNNFKKIVVTSRETVLFKNIILNTRPVIDSDLDIVISLDALIDREFRGVYVSL